MNHYLTDKSLKINFPSLYNAQTYAHLVSVLEIEKNIYHKFQQENNWINNYLAFYDYQKLGNQRKIKPSSFLRFFVRIKEIILNTFLGAILEKLLGFFQKYHIKHHPLKDKKGGRIIADNSQLEFHPASPEAGILDNYNRKMIGLGFKVFEKDSGLDN